uniref:Immunoglobulin subtype domain-containing protein n=1 Tax=Neogobius melanostomus TaxID=47308 RepID=A0A8C6SIS7_9GOBI
MVVKWFYNYYPKFQLSFSQTRFIQTNRDLQLTVTEEVQIGRDIFNWKFNDRNNIIRLTRGEVDHYDDYENRVEFFKQNLSLILKNVQLSDSGIYTAVVSGRKDVILSTYDVRVEVSPVLLSVDSVFNSPESCNFTVSCTTELSPSISRSFTCDRHTCEEASPAPSDPAPSLHLYLSDVSIICNHSNHVSWRKDTKEIQQVCPFGNELILMFDFVLHLGAVTNSSICCTSSFRFNILIWKIYSLSCCSHCFQMFVPMAMEEPALNPVLRICFYFSCNN